MKAHIVIFDVREEYNNPYNNELSETQKAVQALKRKGLSSEVIYYSDEEKEKLVAYCVKKAHGYISKVNAWNLADTASYKEMIIELEKAGLVGVQWCVPVK
ncbi:MAG: hypothetical protein OIF50_10015 [Flavobacteriaceae bacterium]|nr:hypothetical protein [Flavobacteriaceae bacterium]